jgi:polar amino acid transport system substrate-binding protein
MKRLELIVFLVLTAAFVLTACGAPPAATEAPAPPVAPAATEAPTAVPPTEAPTAVPDLLADIKARGYLIVSTDPNYEPQSFLNTAGKRPADTKCPSDTLTTDEMQGFDVDVAAELAKRLGVGICFATPDWDMITAGNWADKWDISVGSMTITPERQKVLDFSVPYYYTPAQIAVAKDSGITALDQLAGKALCVGASTTYESWLNGTLDLPASSIYEQPPVGAKAVSVSTDQECAQAIQAGRRDFVGYVTSGTVIDSNIAAGLQVDKIPGTVFAEELAAAIDKAHTKPIDTLLSAVDAAITDMHSDGTLTSISMKWFKADLTVNPNP